MCNPAAIVIAGAVFSALAKYQESQTEAELAEEQARTRDLQAGDALLRGKAAEGISRIQTGQLSAEQTLAYAAAGVDPSVGTPVTTAGQTAMFGELEAKNAETEALREAWGYKSEAATLRNRARAARAAGASDAVGTLIGGAGIAYGHLAGGGPRVPNKSAVAPS